MFGGCLKGIDTYLHDIMTYILNVQSLKYSHTHTHLNLDTYICMYSTSTGRKFALVEGLSHDLESVPDRFFMSILRGRCGTVKLSPRF